MSSASLPLHVVHADWGKDPKKRRIATAIRTADGRIRARASEELPDAAGLLERRPAEAPEIEHGFFGFDFAIGLPVDYARRVGVTTFPGFLRAFGEGAWPDFARLAATPAEISLARPFYPRDAASGSRQRHLLEAHGVASLDALRRRCERARPGRRAASPIFWTLGGQQVGRATLAGWQEVLLPALARADLDVALWPFDGPLDELLAGSPSTIRTCPSKAGSSASTRTHSPAE